MMGFEITIESRLIGHKCIQMYIYKSAIFFYHKIHGLICLYTIYRSDILIYTLDIS